MRPFRSFLLLLIILTCLTGLYYLFPESGLFPSINDFVPEKLTELPSTLSTDIQPVKPFVADTFPIAPNDTIALSDTLPAIPVNPLKPFLDSLISHKGQLRVMYYGDSQVEGDRITFLLRKLLRRSRQGSGPGLFLPLMPVMYTKTIWLRSSSNWKRYNYLSFKNGELSHFRLGPFMTICRFLPEGKIASVPEKAYVRIRPSIQADSASSEYETIRLFYGNSPAHVSIKIRSDEIMLYSDSLTQGKGIHEITCPLKRAKNIIIEFEGRESPDIYGISVESKTGVIVDNIPQRGSAGLEFTMVDRENLKESFNLLAPDLIVMQYGLNIVKNVREDYTYYRKGLSRQLTLLREIAPYCSILVVGVTDMALNEGDSIRSYSNIPAIIDAQKKAAGDAGIAFWDSYLAMGGNSSVINWSQKSPPLAQSDFVHFTYPGADTLSLLLVKDLFSPVFSDTIVRFSAITLPDTTFHQPSARFIDKPADIKIPEKRIFSGILNYDPDKPLIFSSSAFWLFFLVLLAGYSFIYKRLFIRNIYLFILSLFFYYKSGGLFLLLLILVTIVDFSCGLLIHNFKGKILRRLFIILSVTSNLGILAYFKYTGFFISTVNDLLGTDFQVYDFIAAFSNQKFGTALNISNIILPVGISFFTFQSLSYTIDVYRRKITPVRNIIDFGFYVSFFPQLVAGPIVRASEFIPQLYSKMHLEKREFSHALFLISKGLIKKIVISDYIAVNFIDRVFDMPSIYSGFENLMAVYGYGLQIYCDFSGYTDIAIGLALVLGFRLPVNFNSPYKAADISDFWKRWHISLSRWLKDYLYIPLGGNRKGWLRTNINLIITMLLGGLWHGASLRFIIWGGLHGIGLVFNRIWYSISGGRLTSGRLGKAVAVLITFNFVSFCWIFFRANSMENVTIMLKQIFENFTPGSYLTVIPSYMNVFLLMSVGYIIHFLPEKTKESYRGLFIRFPLSVQMVVIVLIATILYSMRTTDVMPFIYYRF
jgi:D-alanyl-lipoteichoic acid acyltransferase DltB (MBOAT superfamily)